MSDLTIYFIFYLKLFELYNDKLIYLYALLPIICYELEMFLGLIEVCPFRGSDQTFWIRIWHNVFLTLCSLWCQTKLNYSTNITTVLVNMRLTTNHHQLSSLWPTGTPAAHFRLTDLTDQGNQINSTVLWNEWSLTISFSFHLSLTSSYSRIR